MPTDDSKKSLHEEETVDPLDQEDETAPSTEDASADEFEDDNEELAAPAELDSAPVDSASTPVGSESKDSKNMASNSYFLEVIRGGEAPAWSLPETELLVGSQELPGGYSQYWAYPKDSGKLAQSLPEAEVLAQHHPAHKPAVLIDQDGENLELVLVKDSHAWARSESSVANLEDNLASLLELAENKFNLKVENFMTTQRVSSQVNRQLDQLAGAQSGVEDRESEAYPQREPVTSPEGYSQSMEPAVKEELDPGNIFRPSPGPGLELTPKRSGKGKTLILGAVLLLLIGALGFAFTKTNLVSGVKNRLSAVLGSKPTPSAAPSAVPTPAATPQPAVDRSKYSIRVLNGTSTTGAAGKLADQLKTLGWKILGDPANATNSAFVRTQVRVKSGTEDSVGKTLQKDLAPTYDATVSGSLKSSDSADAEVIIGKI